MSRIALHLVALTAAVAVSACGGAGEPDRTADALTACQTAIKRAATNPSAAEIPFTKNHGTAGEYYFAWPHGSGLRLQNDLGALVDASASCTVAADGTTVTSLSISGDTII